MSYKEKQYHQAFGALALSVAMLIPTGCTEQKTQTPKEKQVGLLDPTPIKAIDKYNDAVTLSLVNVPVFNSDGTRKKDRFVLTHGLTNSSYKPVGTETFIRKAYLNNSKTPHYVKTDKNRAIYTENGFSGLFLNEYGEVEVIADKNVSDFVKEHDKPRLNAKPQDGAANIHSVEREELKPTKVDSVSVAERTDSSEVVVPIMFSSDTIITERPVNAADTIAKRREVRE